MAKTPEVPELEPAKVPMKRRQIIMDDPLWADIGKVSRLTKRSRSAVIRFACDQYIASRKAAALKNRRT